MGATRKKKTRLSTCEYIMAIDVIEMKNNFRIISNVNFTR